jgi:hypothetical protein
LKPHRKQNREKVSRVQHKQSKNKLNRVKKKERKKERKPQDKFIVQYRKRWKAKNKGKPDKR